MTRNSCKEGDLASLEEWAGTWAMHFNAKKCNTMKISRSTKPLTKFYTLMEHSLEEVQNSTYLGVTISDNLKWNAHINKIFEKATNYSGSS